MHRDKQPNSYIISKNTLNIPKFSHGQDDNGATILVNPKTLNSFVGFDTQTSPWETTEVNLF